MSTFKARDVSKNPVKGNALDEMPDWLRQSIVMLPAKTDRGERQAPPPDNGPQQADKKDPAGDAKKPNDDKQGDKSNRADISLKLLSDQTQQDVVFLQNTLLAVLPGSDLDSQKKKSMLKALQEDIDGQKFGSGTREAYAAYVNYLQSEIPGYYGKLVKAIDKLPTKGPLKLPKDPDSGKAMSPTKFLTKIANGEVACNLDLDTKALPSHEDLKKFSDALTFMQKARDNIEMSDLSRLQEVVRRRIDREGYPPKWKDNLDTLEQCAAAMIVMGRAKEAGRIAECIDFLGDKITEGKLADRWFNQKNKDEWLAKLKPENLPPGMVLKRENGHVVDVSFDFPDKLDLQSETFRQQLQQIQKFIDKNGAEADQLMDSAMAANMNPRNILARLDMEVPFGWVDFSEKDEKGETKPRFKMGLDKPTEAGDWKRFNMWKLRCGVELVRDKVTGNVTGCKPWNEMTACDVPWYSWLNLYMPQAEGTQPLKTNFATDDKLCSLEGWTAMRLSDTEVKWMKYKNVNDFVEEQDFWDGLGKTVQGTMDVAMVLEGAGALSAGWKAMRAARTGAETIKLLEAAAKAEEAANAISKGQKVTEAAELLAKVQGSTQTLALAQKELFTAGRSSFARGAVEIIMGLGGITRNPGGDQTPVLQQFNVARKIYFVASVAKGTLYDPVKGLASRAIFGKQAPTLAAQLMKANQNTAYWLPDAMSKSGRFLFGKAQWPMGGMLGLEFLDTIRQANDRGKPDGLIQAADRLADAKKTDAKLPEEKTDEELAAISADTARLFLDRYKAAIKADLRNPDPDGKTAKRIDEILEGTKKYLQPPWERKDYAGPPADEQAKKQFESERKKFIEDVLVPNFLTDPDVIRDKEVARAKDLPQGDELRNHPAFTDEEIHQKDLDQQFQKYDPDVQAAASVALFYLTKNKKGELEGISADGKPVEAGILYERKLEIKPWSVEKGGGDDAETIKVPKDRDDGKPQTRTVTQQIKLVDLVNGLEPDLLPGKSSVARRMETGEILIRVGIPLETYGKVLQDVIADKSASKDDRNEAILYLGAVTLSLRKAEQNREKTFGRADLFNIKGLANELSSDKERAFLRDFAKDPNADVNSRAFARYLVALLDRHDLSAVDLNRLDEISKRQPPALSFEEFLTDMSSAAFGPGKLETVADWDRKLQAAVALEDFCDDKGQGKGYTSEACYKSIAECVNAPQQFEKAIEKQSALIQALNDRLEAAKKDNKDTTQLEKDVKEAQEKLNQVQADRIHALEVSLRASDLLLERVKHNGMVLPRINHLDNSSDGTLRDAALAARRQMLDELKQRNYTDEDIRIKRVLIGKIEPMLNTDRVLADTDHGIATKKLLDDLRSESATVLKGLLVVHLLPETDDDGKPVFQKEHAEAKNKNASLVDLTTKYQELYISAQDFPELREAAIYALGDMRVRDAKQLVQSKIYTENEDDADVRLAAVRTLRQLIPTEEMNKLVQDLLDRDYDSKDHPPELDPAVAMALNEKFVPLGLGLAPDGQAFRKKVEDVQTDISKGFPKRDEMQAQVEKNYPWLVNANQLRADIKKAKEDKYNWFTYQWDNDRFFDFTGSMPRLEVDEKQFAEQKKVYKTFTTNFGKLLDTAYECDDAAKQREARDTLWWVATSDAAGWKSDPDADTRLKNAGYGYSNLNVDKEDFRKLQLAAAHTLANCCSKRDASGKLIKLDDKELEHLQQLLYYGLTSENASAECKIEFMRGIRALAEARPDGKDTSVQIAAFDGVPIVQAELEKILKCGSTADGQFDRYTAWLCTRMIVYLDRHTKDRTSYADIQAIATTPYNVKDDPNDKNKKIKAYVPGDIREAALELIATRRDRIIPVWDSIGLDLVGNENVDQRVAMLKDAADAAKKFFDHGQKTQAGGEVTPDILKDLQFLEDKTAVQLICTAVKGMPIMRSDDPRVEPLSDLMNNRYNERVREAAAIAVLKQSTEPDLSSQAIGVLAEQSVRGKELGFRKDAQAVIDSLSTSASLQAAEESFERLRVGMIAKMRGELLPKDFPKDQSKLSTEQQLQLAQINGLSDIDVVKKFCEAHHADSDPLKDDPLVVSYATCLTNLGAIKLRKLEANVPDQEVESLLRGALNLYRGAPIDQELPSDKGLDGRKIQTELETKMAGFYKTMDYPAPRDLHAVCYCLDKLGEYWHKNGGQQSDANTLLSTANGIRMRGLGARHPDFIAGIQRYADFLRDRADAIGQTIRETTSDIATLKEQRKALGNDKENEDLIKKLDQDINEKTISLDNARADYTSKLGSTLTYYEDCLMYSRSAYGSPSLEVAAVFHKLADTRFTLAMADLSDLGALRAKNPKDSRLSNLSSVINEHLSSAQKYYRAEINMREKVDPTDIIKIAQARRALALFYFKTANFTKDRDNAYDCCREQLIKAEELLSGKPGLEAANVERDLALINFISGKNDDGDQAFQRWAAITKALYGSQSDEYISLLTQQATTYNNYKRFDKAEDPLKELVAIDRAAAGKPGRVLSDSLFDLANCYYRQQKMDATEQVLEERLSLDMDSNGWCPRTQTSLDQLIGVCAQRGEYQKIVDVVLKEAKMLSQDEATALIQTYAKFLDDQAKTKKDPSISDFAKKLRASAKVPEPAK
jgi:hypothetical protein